MATLEDFFQEVYPVYIPEAKRALFEEKYRPRGLQKYFVMHKLKSGETLSSLSRRYNVERSTIMDENMMGERDEFKANRIVKIPLSSSFIKKEPLVSDKIPVSAPRLYNFDFDQLRIKNPFNPVKTDTKEENKIVY
jgi:LysM repeat protein